MCIQPFACTYNSIMMDGEYILYTFLA